MVIRKIIQDGDSILEKVYRPVEKFDDKLATLLGDIRGTVITTNGTGLAASRVGILRHAIVVVNVEDNSIIGLMNPEVIEDDDERDGTRGCLSFPGQHGMVKHPVHAKVHAQDRNEKFFEIKGTGFLVRASCHETNHLNEVVFKERVSRILSEDEME